MLNINRHVGIGSNDMKILLRHFENEIFYVDKIKLDRNGTAIYTISFIDSNEIVEAYIQYNHEDKELYGKVVIK